MATIKIRHENDLLHVLVKYQGDIVWLTFDADFSIDCDELSRYIKLWLDSDVDKILREKCGLLKRCRHHINHYIHRYVKLCKDDRDYMIDADYACAVDNS